MLQCHEYLEIFKMIHVFPVVVLHVFPPAFWPPDAGHVLVDPGGWQAMIHEI